MRRAAALGVALATLAAAPSYAQRRPPRRAAEPQAPAASAAGFDSTLFQAMRWRSIGPFRGGRVTAVAGIAGEPFVYYFGATGGGVFKTTDGGANWFPVSDSAFTSGSIGAIAVAPSDHNVVYVGTGESPLRGNITPGDGMYKSTDAGRTWTRAGLPNSGVIAAIRVHPTNPDLVYAAVLGHAFAANPERGVYRSSDGGKTWQRILFRSDSAGAIDLAMDPANPRILYAAFWQAVRRPWELVSGGSGSGLFKSTDGGDTWREITRNPGLPRGVIGKIGVDVSRVNSDRVWAIVEADSGGVFRSDDAGETWRRTNDDRNLRQRAWYYSNIIADPASNDGVYVLNVQFMHSGDGGRTFTSIGQPHGDNHALWVDATNPQRLINGNDGGAAVSVNGGQTWTTLENQPTAQLYHVVTTADYPYRVCGAQQDNTTICVPSRTSGGGIGRETWQILGGCESGYIAVRPDTTAISYAGCYGGALDRQDRRTETGRDINVWPDNPMGHAAGDLRYRFQWTFPIVLSPMNPSVLYTGAQMIFRTTNDGQSWTQISPDLTRNDTTKQRSSGGPITKDNTSIEYYGVVFAIAPSPLDSNLIWAGSDDGLVHVTRDGGRTWTNVTPRDFPEWGTVSIIDASPSAPGTAYLAANRYRLDDFAPYLWKTTDYGRTWTKIVRGIPATNFMRVIREDPEHPGLLYAGGEYGVYVSFDDGASWQSLRLNLPVVPVHDLVVTRGDLVAATHGRSFWILDDLSPLRQLADSVRGADAFLFQPRDQVRSTGGGFGGGRRVALSEGQNPPGGVSVFFALKQQPDSAAKIELAVLDSAGAVVRTATLKPDSLKAGMNRYVWNGRYPDAATFPNLIMWGGSVNGPAAPPGRYQVRLSLGGHEVATRSFRLLPDPRSHETPADYAAQFAMLVRVRDRLSDANNAVVRIRDLKTQLDGVMQRAAGTPAADSLRPVVDSLRNRLSAVEEAIYQVKNRSGQDPLNYPIRLNNRIAALGGVVAGADSRPTDQAQAVFDTLSAALDVQLNELKGIVENDVPSFNARVRGLDVPALVVHQAGQARRGGRAGPR